MKKPFEAVDDGSCASTSGNSSVFSSKRLKISETDEETGDLGEIDSQIVHHNQPVLMEVYLDPDTNSEMLIILASLPGGVTHVEFSLVGSGPGSSTDRITNRYVCHVCFIKSRIDRRGASSQAPRLCPSPTSFNAGILRFLSFTATIFFIP